MTTQAHFLVDITAFPPGWEKGMLRHARHGVNKRHGKQNSRKIREITISRANRPTLYDEYENVIDTGDKFICRGFFDPGEFTIDTVAAAMVDELMEQESSNIGTLNTVKTKLIVTEFVDVAAVHQYLKNNAIEWGERVI